MRPFEYISPGSLDEALEAMVEHAPHLKPLAGGTDLLVDLKHTSDGPNVVMDIGQGHRAYGRYAKETGLNPTRLFPPEPGRGSRSAW